MRDTWPSVREQLKQYPGSSSLKRIPPLRGDSARLGGTPDRPLRLAERPRITLKFTFKIHLNTPARSSYTPLDSSPIFLRKIEHASFESFLHG
jgi:hypothetical protein